MRKGGKMTKAASARISSNAAKTGHNQDFARRAQSAADRNGSESNNSFFRETHFFSVLPKKEFKLLRT